MKFLKALILPTILAASFFLVTSNVKKPKEHKKNSTSSFNKSFIKPILDHKTKALYKKHQLQLQEQLTAYFNTAIANGKIVGAGVSIVQGDSTIIATGFGKRNIKTNAKVNAQTIFRLGSLSKGFAGVLAANLHCQGKLDWNDRVVDYIPEFQLGDTCNTQQITIANILSQTSGAPYHSYTNLVEAGLPLTDIAGRFKTVQPISKPGELYSYQNALFALSGEIMEEIAGQSINSLLKETFFKPLKMQQISMDNSTLLQQENVALPHTKRRFGWKPLKLNQHYYNAVAAGGINASTLDMAKWMKLLLGQHPEIMDSADLQEVFTPVINIPGHSKYYQRWSGHKNSYYGFGWRIHNFEELGTTTTILHHGGSVNNYRNEIALFPENNIGICVLLNSNSKLAKTVIPELYRIVNKVLSETEL